MNEHITSLLERGPVSALGDRERAIIEAHTKTCADCLRAFDAVTAGSELLQARASLTIEPTPFFTARVMAGVRATKSKHLAPVGMWEAARALIGSMMAVVVMLVLVSVYIGGLGSGGDAGDSSGEDVYSTEWVVMNNSDDADLTDNQVLTTLYDASSDYGEY
jgi:hypothetical protein